MGSHQGTSEILGVRGAYLAAKKHVCRLVETVVTLNESKAVFKAAFCSASRLSAKVRSQRLGKANNNKNYCSCCLI